MFVRWFLTHQYVQCPLWLITFKIFHVSEESWLHLSRKMVKFIRCFLFKHYPKQNSLDVRSTRHSVIITRFLSFDDFTNPFFALQSKNFHLSRLLTRISSISVTPNTMFWWKKIVKNFATLFSRNARKIIPKIELFIFVLPKLTLLVLGICIKWKTLFNFNL